MFNFNLKKIVIGISVALLLFSENTFAERKDTLPDTVKYSFEIKAHKGGAYGVAFDPSGKFMASCGLDGLVKIWDTRTWKLNRVLTGHSRETSAIAYSKDGKYLVSAGYDQKLIIWDAISLKLIHIVYLSSWSVALDFNNANQLAVGLQDGKVLLTEIPSGKIIKTIDCGFGVNSLSFSSDDHYLVTGGPVTIWNMPTGVQLKRLKVPGGVSSVAFSPGSTQLVSTHSRGTAYISDAISGDTVFTVQSSKTMYVPSGAGNIEKNVKLPLIAACYDHDGSLLAISYYDNKIVIFNPKDHREKYVLQGFTTIMTAMAFTNDCKTLVSCSSDGKILIWKLR